MGWTLCPEPFYLSVTPNSRFVNVGARLHSVKPFGRVRHLQMHSFFPDMICQMDSSRIREWSVLYGLREGSVEEGLRSRLRTATDAS